MTTPPMTASELAFEMVSAINELTGVYICVTQWSKIIPIITARDTALLAEKDKEIERLSQAVIVPGMMHCAKCNFVLTKINLRAASGNTSAGDNKTEPCPNRCGPLWPYTWKQMAQSYGERLEQQFDEMQFLEAALAQHKEG